MRRPVIQRSLTLRHVWIQCRDTYGNCFKRKRIIMEPEIEALNYELRLVSTSSGVGYFTCCPMKDMGIDAALAHLRACPNDEFMHKHILDRITECDEKLVEQLIAEAQHDPVFFAILCEAVLSEEKFAGLKTHFDKETSRCLLEYTPLIYIKSSLLEDQWQHQQWIEILRQNIMEHRPINDLPVVGLPPCSVAEESPDDKLPVPVEQIRKKIPFHELADDPGTPKAGDTARNALDKLQRIGVVAGAEIKHTSSLSPHGFYRKWHLSLSVEHGRHSFTLSGIQTSYGKGLTESIARASYAMEMVERCSSFSSFDQRGTVGFVRDYPLVHARYDEIKNDSIIGALDPNALNLEVPYSNEPLYWLEGAEVRGDTSRPVLIPAQSVFLFCNLDEISLFSGLGSTGLASGNSVEQAKVNALLEVIERDAEAVSLYDISRCFRLDADDPAVAALLADYDSKGVHLQFQDIGREFGIPCYKCFVVGSQGQIIKGTGAHLDGKRALISAMTETPYPYPRGPASLPPSKELPTFRFEELPNYSSGSHARDLAILESVLLANGFSPIYIDLTRRDIGLPVVKALVPGLELMADFDRFSRLSPRLLSGLHQIAHIFPSCGSL